MFDLGPTPLAGLRTLLRHVAEDERGAFGRLYCAAEFAAAGIELPVAQVNLSQTRTAGTVRGMHFQYPPHAEAKLVSCLRGEIFDVALDLRAGSPTFLQWHAQVLSAANRTSMFIPPGIAHGFQSLCADCEIVYFHSVPYVAGAAGIIDALDSALAIPWPLPVTRMSERDRSSALAAAGFPGLPL